jgi:hypothetical protein
MRETDQIEVGLQEDIPGTWSETWPASCHEGTEDIGIKTYVISDVGELENSPMPASLQGVKVEYEVSFASVCPLLGTLHTCL